MSISDVIAEQHSPTTAGIRRYNGFVEFVLLCKEVPCEPHLIFKAKFFRKLSQLEDYEEQESEVTTKLIECGCQFTCLSFCPGSKNLIRETMQNNNIYIVIDCKDCGPAHSYTLYCHNSRFGSNSLVPFLKWTYCQKEKDGPSRSCNSCFINIKKEREVYSFLNAGVHPITFSHRSEPPQ